MNREAAAVPVPGLPKEEGAKRGGGEGREREEGRGEKGSSGSRSELTAETQHSELLEDSGESGVNGTRGEGGGEGVPARGDPETGDGQEVPQEEDRDSGDSELIHLHSEHRGAREGGECAGLEAQNQEGAGGTDGVGDRQEDGAQDLDSAQSGGPPPTERVRSAHEKRGGGGLRDVPVQESACDSSSP